MLKLFQVEYEKLILRFFLFRDFFSDTNLILHKRPFSGSFVSLKFRSEFWGWNLSDQWCRVKRQPFWVFAQIRKPISMLSAKQCFFFHCFCLIWILLFWFFWRWCNSQKSMRLFFFLSQWVAVIARQTSVKLENCLSYFK